MHTVAGHLETCKQCESEFGELREMQQVLSRVGSLKSPADLGIRLRLAISHEVARQQGHWWDGLSLQWDNLLRPMLVQVSAGLASALVLIGSLVMLVGVVATPQTVQAHDEPLGALTMPHYLYSAARLEPAMNVDGTIVVRAYINAAGEVYDYTVLSGTLEATVATQVRDQLMVQVYEPARVFNEPVRGQVLVTFSGISVHG